MNKEMDILKKALRIYAGDHVLERVLTKHEEALHLGGERRVLTIYSSDIRPFTEVPSQFAPDDMPRLLNQFLTVMSECIAEHGGTVDHYQGNAILAYWDANSPDGATQACECALACCDVADSLSTEWKPKGLQPIFPEIAVNTGSVLLGNFGSTSRMAFTIVGDQVNFTERLQIANRHYGTQILISDSTQEHLDGSLRTRRLEDIIVKGRPEKRGVFALDREQPTRRRRISVASAPKSSA